MKTKRKSVTTKNTAKKKKVEPPVIELTDISEQEKRRLHGDAFELDVDLKLIKAGVPGIKVTINTPNDGAVISDHCYDNYWMESTTWFDKKRVDEFNKKKKQVESNSSKFTKFILFFEKTLNKKALTLAEPLKKAGWIIIAGEDNINAFIDMLAMRHSNVCVNGVIRTTTPQYIDRKLLFENDLNRDQKPKGVLQIAKSIVKHGFLTCLYAVPTYKNKKLIGYTLFEGHHRLAAINLVNEWGFTLDNIPCVVVDWLTMDELEEVGRLLIKINVEYKKWELIDYIKLYYKLANKLKLTDVEYSYGRLIELYEIAKPNGFTESFLVYIFGKTTGSTLFLDRENIQDGEFRMSQDEYENKVLPFMEALKKPYTTAYAKKKYVSNVYQYLCKRLYSDFKNDIITLADVKMWLGGYNYLDIKDIPTKTEELKEMWNTTLKAKVTEVQEMFV
jgi:hypothetical protein